MSLVTLSNIVAAFIAELLLYVAVEILVFHVELSFLFILVKTSVPMFTKFPEILAASRLLMLKLSLKFATSPDKTALAFVSLPFPIALLTLSNIRARLDPS